ncbi:uncharacterized protein [Onthophagus taurus]|uniref:uncharacterized protein n=1 Tax=Onthophagus taurus TaxID=166361 RepID=UPI0039BE7C9D
MGTGGGPCEEKLNPLRERIRNLIKLSCDGTPSQFDSDCLDVQDELQSTSSTDKRLKRDEAFISPSTSVIIDTEQIETKNPSIYPHPNTQVIDADDIVEGSNNWSHYSPAQLKKAKHPALQTRKGKRPSKKMNLSAAGQKFSLG